MNYKLKKQTLLTIRKLINFPKAHANHIKVRALDKKLYRFDHQADFTKPNFIIQNILILIF